MLETPESSALLQSKLYLDLMLQADVSILDEIDSGLDIDALRDVAAAVNGLKRDDSATIMVTHYKARHTSLPIVACYFESPRCLPTIAGPG